MAGRPRQRNVVVPTRNTPNVSAERHRTSALCAQRDDGGSMRSANFSSHASRAVGVMRVAAIITRA